MKQTAWLIFLLCGLASSPAQIGIYQHGSVVRMHMGDCTVMHQGFLTNFGPPSAPQTVESCPEYTLISDNVVFVIVGRSSNQLIPLAETIDFRFQKNELAVRVDDAKREVKFTIKDMIVRSEWDRVQRHIDEKMKAPEVREAER